ncbi:sodium-coupled monocarboxylate transporter 1-like [Ylistrum balloti]|uniref:sodium-coupled monocarboxylate transporter 1-like n=1 Tax=Ylistrum balloti TaxID=509963 RepID=UPI002905EA3D|nr:sodium-coupled monocarboxylate transporter 1-like [Ylistrum balloti]
MDIYTESSLKTCKKVCELCDGEQIGSFVAVDYVLFAGVLVVSALIGVFYMVQEARAAKQATADDVLMGGRDIGIFPIAMSLMASFMSAITVLGTPTEMYNNNTSYWIAGNAIIITTILTNHVFLPFFHKLSLTSAYEYLEKRFNVVVRVCASLIFMMNMLLYMGVVLYAPALALNQVTGLSLSLSIVCIGLVCTFYTALGGLRAVVWTDTFQTFVVMAGLIAIIVVGSREVGGLDRVWQIAEHGGRIHFIDWSADPTVRHSFWALVIGSIVGQLTIYAANQTMIQRYLAIKEITNSKRALYVSLPLTLILSTVVCLVGIVIYATYHDCDPKILNLVKARDQLLPFLVMDKLTFLPGLPGLFVASLFSASLSSISSGLNALAIVILEDILKIYWRHNGGEPLPVVQGRIAKVLGFICGGMVIGIAFLSQFLGQTVLQIMLSIFGMVGGPLLGLFLNGIFLPWVNSAGAFCGLVCSAVLTFWVGVGGSVILPIPPIKKVSASICQHFQRNCTSSADNQNTATLYSTMTPISTIYYNTSTEIPTAATPNGQDLWIYHISYLWYALFAVLISLFVGTVVTLLSNFCTDLNRPEDLDKELVHPVSDRVCCYPALSCQKVNRLTKPPSQFYESSSKKTEAYTYDGPYTVTNGDLELQPNVQMTQTRYRDTSRQTHEAPGYHENGLMPDNDDDLTKL